MGVKGAILGDIAGSRFEYLSKDQRKEIIGVLGKNYNLFDKEKCFCTDDSICSIAIMDAVLNGKKLLGRISFEKYLTYHCNKYPGAGYGKMFQAWLESKKQRPYNSYGNGSAMRVSFIGEYFKRESDVEKYAAMSSRITHSHEEGIKGAVVTAKCIWMAENGFYKKEICEYLTKEYPYGHYLYDGATPIFEYKHKYKYNEKAELCVPVAIRAFIDTENFTELMYLLNEMDCDSDTLGAIGGAVADSYYKKCTSNIKTDLKIIEKFLFKDLYSIVDNYYVLQSPNISG